MSRPRLATLLVFVAVVPGAAVVAASSKSGRHHHPPLLDCGPAPILSKNDDTAFRANLASALADLPSVVAVAPDAFAILNVGTSSGPGSASARGVCFSAANVSSSPALARACEACLSAAARDVTGGCRAGVWRAGCFLSYAESSVSSAAGEKQFQGWFYYVGPSTNVSGGACLTDGAVDCDQCLRDSERAAAAIGWLQRIRGEEVIVVGYSCFLRARISTLPKGPDGGTVGGVVFSVWLTAVYQTAGLSLVILFVRIVVLVRALPQVNNG
ncbi:hypothetical protein QOZ80_2BG0165240 [Eleusine coracana subsp. coracana]|nr:hypothetical protein QOZ80_2BG0165240 [Eleusine coracana subsp. coracana]